MRSDKNVTVIVQFQVHEGQDDALRSLAGELCAATESEKGTLNYEWSVAEDGRTLHLLERYADSDAFRIHLDTFAPFGERFMGMVDIVSAEVYGSPDAQACQVLSELSGGSATFNRPYAGFVR